MTGGFSIGQLWASLGLDISQFQAGMASANASMLTASEKMTKSLNNVSQKFRTFGYLASAVITLPIVAAAKASTRMSMEFEFSMKKMIGLAGVTAMEIAGIEAAIKKMAIASGEDPLKLVETFYFLRSSGLSAKAAMEAFNVSAMGAASGMGEVRDVANLLTSALNAYETEGLTAARVMDVLTASIREGKAEPAEMVNAFGTVLPIAQELGVGIAEIGGALAVLTLTTTSTSTSATYLRNVLFKLLHPSEQVEQAFIKMKTSVKEVQDMLRNQGFDVTMKYLDQLLAQHGKIAAEVFPDIRSLIAFLNYTGQSAEKTSDIMEEVDRSMGDFGGNLRVMAETMKRSWNSALSQIKVSAIGLGNVIGPYLIKMFQWLAKVVKSLTEWLDSLSDGMQHTVVIFAMVLAALGPLSLLISVMGYSLSGLIPIVKGVIVVFKTLTSVMSVNPYALAAIAIAGLIAAFLSLTSSSKRVLNVTEELQKVQESINTEYAKHAATIKLLVAMIENENLSNDDRLVALGKLKEIMPEYNGMLSDEGKLINHNKEEIDNYLVSLKEKIRLQKSMDALEKAMVATIEAEERLKTASFDRSEKQTVYGMFPKGAHWVQKGEHAAEEAYYVALKKEKGILKEVNILRTIQKTLEDSIYTTAVEGQTKLNTSLQDYLLKLKGLYIPKYFPIAEGEEWEEWNKQRDAILATRDALEQLQKVREDMYAFYQSHKELHTDMTWGEAYTASDKNKPQTYGGKWFDAFKGNDFELPFDSGSTSNKGWAKDVNMFDPALQKWVQFKLDLTDGMGDINREFERFIENSISLFAEGFGKMLVTGDFSAWGKTILSQLGEIMITFGNMLIAFAVGKIALDALFTSLGAPGAIAAGIGLVILGGAVKAGANTIKEQIESFASGGIVYGPTLAQVGEYSGARSNPEVIAPLSKLSSLLGGINGGEVRFRIEGDQLVGILNKQQTRNSIY